MGCERSWNLRILLIAASLYGFGVSSASAQTYAGLELGYGRHELRGIYNYWPGIQFYDGSGYSIAPWLLLESRIDSSWSFGFNTGLDIKHGLTTNSSIDTTIVQIPPYQGSFFMPWRWSYERAEATITYIRFNPYIRYSLFQSVFIRVGPGIMYRIHDEYETVFEKDSAGSRTIVTTSTRLKDDRKVRMSAVFSAGYTWQFHQVVIEPLVTYEQPLTSLQDYPGLTLSSLYLTAAFKIKI
jgi:hypothetical protein